MLTKSILFVALAALLLASGCGQKAPSATETTSTVETHAEHTHDAVPAHGLSLNNGAKWQADASTRERVAALDSLNKRFAQTASPDLQDYHDLARNAQIEIDALISGCRMKGPDHDALHLWLEQVMDEVRSLQSAGTEADARTVWQRFSQDVHKFGEYFQ